MTSAAATRKYYDLIGDIHGCAETLTVLLQKLGYREHRGAYRYLGETASKRVDQYPVSDQVTHQVIFLGDFIDRGPGQRKVVDIVRSMLAQGSALAVMGNHEFNAIAYATRDLHGGGYLRAHSRKNTQQHAAFLTAYADAEERQVVIDWFRLIPLWLDLGDLRVVHACWERQSMQRILECQQGSTLLGNDLLLQSCHPGTWQYGALETLLKGKEIPLPPGVVFHDKENTARHHIRVRWWDDSAENYRAAFLGPESARTGIPEDPIQGEHLVEYGHGEPPVFLGHYWFEGTPVPLAGNIACLDYSVARPGGKLVAYRWQGEQQLVPEHFCWVPRQEP